ncbi:hypothetical protein [Cesiribacter andamanensis]|uniref:DUF4595 domain-containing protein n=1 Tax=Cesiribacter andamanensis AMV16 TaxID=1279009 RepID=M7NTV6_9BACT|nr:hypothetical protein [Cesiribacter andamanensis]EMR01909.1 hypothetical protein ADICEAN_02978 [Cesiribacter andamanensis AMV16]
MKSTFFLIVLLGALLGACEGSDSGPDKLFIKEIEIQEGQQGRKLFFRYEHHKLIQYLSLTNDQLRVQTDFEYADGKLKKIFYQYDGRLRSSELYYHPNGTVNFEITTWSRNGVNSEDTTQVFFHYDDSGRLVSKRETYNNPPPFYTEREIEFDWSNGNLVQMRTYSIQQEGRRLDLTTTYTYDESRNYSNQDMAFAYLSVYSSEYALSINNVVSSEEYFGDTIVPRGFYQFRYNNKGYPSEYTYSVSVEDEPLSNAQIRY